MRIYHYMASTYRLGNPSLRKPHRIVVFIGDTTITLKFNKKDYETMFEMNKVILDEMALNVQHQILRNLSEVRK